MTKNKDGFEAGAALSFGDVQKLSRPKKAEPAKPEKAKPAAKKAD